MAAGNQGITVIGMAAQFALAGGGRSASCLGAGFSGKTSIVLTPGLRRHTPLAGRLRGWVTGFTSWRQS